MGNINLQANWKLAKYPGDKGDHGGVVVKVNGTLYEAVSYNNGSASYEWGASDTTIGTSTDTTAYNGASNTNICMNNSACFTPRTSSRTTIWKELQNYRTSTGLSTWFVPSVKEIEVIRTGGSDVKGSDTIISTWFVGQRYAIWSSTESTNTSSWYYGCLYGNWETGIKSNDLRILFFLPL